MPRPVTRLEVVIDGSKWIVSEHGIGRLTTHPDQQKAAAAARAVAAIHTPSELIIRRADGSIESRETFKR